MKNKNKPEPVYINQNNTRWKFDNPQDMMFILVLPDNKKRMRRADFFETFGDNTTIHYRLDGKRFCAVPKNEKGETTNLKVPTIKPYIFHNIELETRN